MIKAVIFDCFGVLTTDLWKEFVATLEADQVSAARDLNHAYDSGHITHDEFLRQIVELTGRRPQEVENTMAGSLYKNTAILDYIGELTREYKIGMLSNIATNWVREQLLSEQEQTLFDDFVFSFEVGTTKPDLRIFEIAADRLGVSTPECIMIDDVDRNVKAAKDAGMQSIAYTDFTQMKTELEQLLHNPKN